ncbi:MAG: PadR family transcriptional regulator [Acidobacteria bacterium]|nr:PadR family transcriptional regulator [Acidobacteriota bacterium]
MSNLELIRGTVDMLVLRALVDAPKHGYAVAQWIRATSNEELLLEEGALYPALHRLAERGWVMSEWGLSENNRRAKFYSLTGEGEAQLTERRSSWERYAAAVGGVLNAESDG